jgi:hypothetical protein
MSIKPHQSVPRLESLLGDSHTILESSPTRPHANAILTGIFSYRQGDFFVAAVMSSTLAKLALKRSKASNDEGANNRFAGA